ncbi:MAG: hypothetical protein ACYCPW_01630 [Nitrososphaerales archaeon]
MAIDTIAFRDDGKSSFAADPDQSGIAFCKRCRSWHAKLQLDSGLEFCAFCNTTHHSRACRAGLQESCPDKSIDPIHNFLTRECLKHQEFDLSFCRECNCFHSKQGWRVCLESNRPKRGWSQKRKLVWEMRWQVCGSNKGDSSVIKTERSLFNLTDLMRIVPYEYPFSNGKFVHHCNV